MTPSVALTIAAHDPLGGAGIAADLTTFAALGVHGMVAITAVTAQRFDAVERVASTEPDLLAAQLDGIIASTAVAAVKVGLLASVDQVAVVADRVERGALPKPVVDPVMVDGRGRQFVGDDVVVAARAELWPRAAALTPNRAEAALLGDDPAALAALGADLVVVTGGAAAGTDLLVRPGAVDELATEWIDTDNVRGSGCTFAAAMTALLASGHQLEAAARAAKTFVEQRLRVGADWTIAAPGVSGPVAHTFGGAH